MKLKEKVVRYLRKKITDPDYAFEVQEGDVFLVSYPKSGNTWMRFLLAGLLSSNIDDIKKYDIEKNIPDVNKIKNVKRNKDLNIFKTHSYYKPKYSFNKIIYLVRDPRDILLSYYNYKQRRSVNKIIFNDFFENFLTHGVDNYGNWGGHTGGWLGAKSNSSDFLIIKYEDMLEDAQKEIKRVINFLDLGDVVSEEKAIKTINNCSFENLKKKENEILETPKKIKKINKNKGYFFNKGKRNQWKNELNSQQIGKIEKKFGRLIKQLGY